MPQVPLWSRATIRELLAFAEQEGEAIAECESSKDAKSFRYAIYDFRQRHAFGLDLTISISGNYVHVTKKEKPSVVILNGASP